MKLVLYEADTKIGGDVYVLLGDELNNENFRVQPVIYPACTMGLKKPHIKMKTVNGWCAGGEGRVMGEMGKDLCPNFLQPFLENIDRRSCNDGSRTH